LRKLDKRFNEIDVSLSEAKEKMRSAPVLDQNKLEALLGGIPENVETALSDQDAE